MSGPVSELEETRGSFIDSRGWVIADKVVAHYLWRNVVVEGKPVYADTDLRTRLAPHPDDVGLPPYNDVATPAMPPAREEPVQWPAILVERTPGGGINADGYEDLARLQITAFGLTRNQSDAMTAEIRGLMHDLSDGEYLELEFDRIREDTGPGRVPDPNEDLRAVPTRWTVRTRNQP